LNFREILLNISPPFFFSILLIRREEYHGFTRRWMWIRPKGVELGSKCGKVPRACPCGTSLGI